MTWFGGALVVQAVKGSLLMGRPKTAELCRFLGSGLILSALLFALGCAPQKNVVISGDQTLAAGPDYLSPKDIAAKGKNPIGIDQSAWAFWPEEMKADWLKHARSGADTSRLPSPSWDYTYRDTKTTRHDCVRIEKLFTIRWGWENGAVGLKESDYGKKTPTGFQDRRFSPLIARVLANRVVRIWDGHLQRVTDYRYDGSLVAARSYAVAIKEGIDQESLDAQPYAGLGRESARVVDHNAECPFLASSGTRFTFLAGTPNAGNGGNISFCDKKNMECIIYLPGSQIKYIRGSARYDDVQELNDFGIFQRAYAKSLTEFQAAFLHAPRACIDIDGAVIHFLVDDLGVHVYRYTVL